MPQVVSNIVVAADVSATISEKTFGAGEGKMIRELDFKCGPKKLGVFIYLKRQQNKSCVYFFLRGPSLPCERVRIFVVNQNQTICREQAA